MENLTTETFKEKIFDYTTSKEWLFKGQKPAILDFSAEWCSPCKIVAPILEELSTEYANIDFYKIDIETEVELTSTFSIRNVPSILLIPVIGEPKLITGALPKQVYKNAIKDVLGIE